MKIRFGFAEGAPTALVYGLLYWLRRAKTDIHSLQNKKQGFQNDAITF